MGPRLGHASAATIEQWKSVVTNLMQRVGCDDSERGFLQCYSGMNKHLGWSLTHSVWEMETHYSVSQCEGDVVLRIIHGSGIDCSTNHILSDNGASHKWACQFLRACPGPKDKGYWLRRVTQLLYRGDGAE